MTALERLFRLEIEFAAVLRTVAPGMPEFAAPDPSWALAHGYQGLVRSLPKNITRDGVDAVKNPMLLAGDLADVLHARDSICRLLGLREGNKTLHSRLQWTP